MTEPAKPKSARGFAAMTAEKRTAIASKGGKSVPKEKRSFSMNRGLASSAGQKGGLAVPDEKRAFSVNHKLASEAGAKGARAGKSAKSPTNT